MSSASKVWFQLGFPVFIVLLLAVVLTVILPSLPQEKTTEETGFKVPLLNLDMRIIPAGRFSMGNNDGLNNERPQRQVKLGAFYLGETEVTQAQWMVVMGSNPSLYKHPERPVDQVTWIQVQEFIQRLNENEKTTKYRLPTEAEWEYAARSGTATSYPFPKNKLAKFAWYGHSGNVGTRPVDQRQRNAWGLADMHGNVWEWVEDCWHDDYTEAPNDGRAWVEQADCANRVLRGGAWNSANQYVRSATRGSYAADMNDSGNGFRLARSL